MHQICYYILFPIFHKFSLFLFRCFSGFGISVIPIFDFSRSLWDTQTINWRTIATLNAENCDLFQYVINDTPSHPTRDAMVVRYVVLFLVQKKEEMMYITEADHLLPCFYHLGGGACG